MPKKKIENKKAYKLSKYSNSDLERALEDVRKGLSLGQAAKQYGIPKSTLHAKTMGRIPEIAKKGPETVLTNEEETRLEKWILDKAKLGFPMHPDEVKNSVQKVLKEAPRPNQFIDDRPGNKWLQLFMKRHPNITIKQTEIISKGRASVTEEKLRAWFGEVKSHLEGIGAVSVLTRPESIFNGDETGVQLCPKSGRLLCQKGEKDAYEIASGKEKETITVLCTFSAAGVALPPMILFNYKRIPMHLTQSVPDDWPVGRSDSGWMVSRTFYEYITGHFHPWCIKNGVEFPVIYFLDGHKSHLSLELSDFCVKHNIILFCLFPNSTHIIQPCDVAIFRALKYKWKNVVQDHRQETQKSITKATFAPLFKKAFDQITEDSIKNGFKICGLYPFDENAVNYEKCISARRKELNQYSQDGGTSSATQSDDLTYDDFLTVAKFLRRFLGEKEIRKFINQKRRNESSDDPYYLLWKSCMDSLELYSEQSESVPPIDSLTRFGSSNEAVDDQLSTTGSANADISSNGGAESVIMIDDAISSNTELVMNSKSLGNQNKFSNIPEIPENLESSLDDHRHISLVDCEHSVIIELDESATSLFHPEDNINSNQVFENATILLDDSETDISQAQDNTLHTVDIDDSIDNNNSIADSEHELSVDNIKEVNNNNSESIGPLTEASTGGLNKGTTGGMSSKMVDVETGIEHPQLIRSTSKKDISHIWDKHLLWPETGAVGKNKKKPKEQLPSALTAAKWREYHIHLKEEKLERELEAKKKAQERLEKKREKELKSVQARLDRENKREERLKMKEENEAKKRLIRAEKLKVKENKDALAKQPKTRAKRCIPTNSNLEKNSTSPAAECHHEP